MIFEDYIYFVYLLVCVCSYMCVAVQVYHTTGVLVTGYLYGVRSLLLNSCGSWGLSSGCQSYRSLYLLGHLTNLFLAVSKLLTLVPQASLQFT